jgi:hypothetical protein
MSATTLLLDYNSKDELAFWVKQNCTTLINEGRLVYYRYTSPHPFKMAHAKNLAHRLAIREGADLLVNVDADNFTGRGFDAWIWVNQNTQRYFWSRMVKENGMTRGISGRIAVTREQFLLTGGYDEQFETWSPDDKDFNQRLEKMGFEGLEVDPKFLHAITHNDKVRFREYPHAATSSSEDFELPGREGIRVVNGGRVGCGTVYRNFNSIPIHVQPYPTRVFGIGMHKTGTTSLCKALKVLGFSCKHWESAHWAKKIYYDLMEKGSSVTMEQTMAVTDLPIGLFYRELDQSYPGSKFILTVRKEDEWLESVEKHFSPSNCYYPTWDHDPFSHRLHLFVYGRRKFDKDVFLHRYRQHNFEVKDYFKDKANLLVTELNHDWHELCGFLGARLPSVPFPKENVTT